MGDPEIRQRAEVNLRELDFHKRLQELRQALELSQADLAKKANLSQPYIARLERGAIRNIELLTLARTAVALGARIRVVIESDTSTVRSASLDLAELESAHGPIEDDDYDGKWGHGV